MASDDKPQAGLTLLRRVDLGRDHARGGLDNDEAVTLVVYGDYLCPYCRRLRVVLAELRSAFGESLIYVYRHLPNEREHPGAELLSRAAEAAAAQDKFWEMHDWLYEKSPPISMEQVLDFAHRIGLDPGHFQRDLDSEATRLRVDEDLAEGRRNGLTVTPTLFVNGQRYDDAWDFHSLFEALRRPLAETVKLTARAFANLPASGGLALLLAAIAALVCANTPLAASYHAVMDSLFVIGPPGRGVSMTVAEWFSQGFLAGFFLLVGLEIRREMTSGALADPRAAVLPVLAAVGGVLVPAAIYLAIATPAIANAWSVPTATDIAFTLGILALLGNRVSPSLRVFVAALAVVDDVLSILTLAIFYPRAFDIAWLPACVAATAFLYILNRSRVYAGWPYALVACGLWLSLQAAGIHAALAGVVLAILLPTRPAPAVGPLLAQAATALATLDGAERDSHRHDDGVSLARGELVRESASRNLSAAVARLLSPAERIERAVAPWSTYVILPLFAFSATGIALAVGVHSSDEVRILAGVILGLVLGKPIGVLLASWLAIGSGVAIAPRDTSLQAFLGAACLCGVGDTVALLMADQAFPIGSTFAALAKVGVLAGSTLAAALGATIIAGARRR